MRKHRLLLGVGAAVVVVAVVLYATLGRYLFARGTTTPVPLAEIEQRYFASTSTSASAPVPRSSGATTVAPAPAVLPAAGVYVYTTSGSDRIDALGGDHHDYPATTTITVTASGCGVLQRWDVLEERWEAWQRCTVASGTVGEDARTNYDEFFDNGVLEQYSCTGEPRPVTAPPGATWTTRCIDGGGHGETHSGSVVGREARQVGEMSADTLHVTVVVTDDDGRNRQTIDTRYLAGTDLVVAQTSSDHAVNSSPIGDVDYDEQYSIALTSLTPVTAS